MKNLLISVLCVLATACGGESVEVDDIRSMHPDDMAEDRPRRTEMPEPEIAEAESEPVAEAPMARPIGEDPEEETIVDDEAVVMEEEPEASLPATPEPAAMPELEDVAAEPVVGGVIGSIVDGSEPQPESTIIIPSFGIGVVGFALRVDEGSDPARLVGATACQVNENAVPADFTEVGIAYAGKEYLASDATEPVDGCWSIGPSENELILDRERILGVSGGSMWLWGAPAVPRPSSEEGDDLPRSGHTPQLFLVDMTLESLVDGSRVVVPGNVLGNPMTLRASEVRVLQDGIPNVPLTDGQELDIHRVELHALNIASVKHLEVTLEKDGAFEVADFRVYRTTDWQYGSREEISSDEVVVNTYVDQAHGAMTSVPSDVEVAILNVEWLQEEVVSNRSTYLTITAQTVGVESGDSLRTYYWESLNERTFMGYITPLFYGAFGISEDPEALAGFGGTIIWSDRSEGDAHGEESADWINDFGILVSVSDASAYAGLVAP